MNLVVWYQAQGSAMGPGSYCRRLFETPVKPKPSLDIKDLVRIVNNLI